VRGVTSVGFQLSIPRGVAMAHALLSDQSSAPADTAMPRRLFGLPTQPPGEPPHADLPAIESLALAGGPQRPPRGRRPPYRALLLPIVAIAGVAALLVDAPIFTAVGVLLLASLALLAGWQLGEHRRVAIQSELDQRGDDLRRALSELEIAQAETVRRLSMAVEFRDEDTGAHIERIGRFSTLLAQAIGMPAEFCRRIAHAAPLHDVGKVAIPDAILLKPGSLTPEERAIVETHAEEGHRLLRGSSSSILDMGATIALSHHERWDGGGYPRGAAAEKIPIEGRIVAIADVFDALTSHRVYRDAFSVEQAREMMLAESGKHFDPVLLQAFMEVLDSSGVDARARERSDPQTLVAGALEIYTDAMRLGDAELAEEAIAQAIEDGIDPVQLQDEVIAPAMRRVEALREGGEIEVEVASRADAITARVMATMSRYMLARG
jgi:HD-GYP domain-containing protein (c-di-GMP phosphodiesterase class II)